jgi:hypothetical protein
MIRYILLNPDDIHSPGDEMLIQICPPMWQSVWTIHMGQEVGEGNPCRRPLSRAGLLKLAEEAARENRNPPDR